MGANVSTNINNIKSSLKTETNTECTQEANSIQTLSGVTANLEGTQCRTISFTNSSAVNQQCNMDAMVSTVATALQSANAKQLASMGLAANVATNINDRKSEVAQKIKQKCGTTANIIQTLGGNVDTGTGIVLNMKPWCFPPSNFFQKPTCFPSTCDDISFANTSNSQQMCVSKLISESIDKIEQDAKSDQTVQLFSLGVGGAVCCIVVIIVIAAMMMKKKGGDGDGGLAGLDKASNAGNAGNAGKGAAWAGQQAKQNQGNGGMLNLVNLGKAAFAKKGGGRKRIAKAFNGVPLIVIVIIALVWYAKTH